jgi:hypothetical protein
VVRQVTAGLETALAELTHQWHRLIAATPFRLLRLVGSHGGESGCWRHPGGAFGWAAACERADENRRAGGACEDPGWGGEGPVAAGGELLTSTCGDYQHRYLGLVGDLIAEDRAAGLMSDDVPLEDLAYAAVRITESDIHTRVITGEQPDARRAETVLRALLR